MDETMPVMKPMSTETNDLTLISKKNFILLVIVLFSLWLTGCKPTSTTKLPNILWITSEDNSPLLGCYGDDFATTPNLDQLASEGFLYTHAYANCPVCAPTRNTIITGVYANSNGNQHMRSMYSKSEVVRTYPEYLRELGYYCTNNSKTDYNTNSINPNEIWDESSKTAHYKNRAPEQPFFAIFNLNISHESRIHKSTPNEELRHSPKEVPLPPYHPATPEMKHDWAQYYDKVEDMDTQVGELLAELDAAGLTENTIVFYYADHGGVLARSKRYVYETGTHVPFIIRIPEKFKKLFPAEKSGSKVNRLISFIDLAPTLLNMTGIKIPEYMQGKAFLGKQKTEDPEYVYMFRGRMDERYDMSRALRDKQYRYIRNYMPYRPYGQHLQFLWKAPSVPSWEKAYRNGECNKIQSAFWEPKPSEELYDTENDPWEINNLANQPEYKEILERMRIENRKWLSQIYDTGFIPETDGLQRKGDRAMYDYMRSNEKNLEAIIDAAEMATIGKEENLQQLIDLLKNDDSAIRYWAATGLLILKDKAEASRSNLLETLNDTSAWVVCVAAEALYNLGEQEKAKQALLSVLKNPDEMSRCYALNVIDCIGESSPEIKDAVERLIRNNKAVKPGYDIRATQCLIEKWDAQQLNGK